MSDKLWWIGDEKGEMGSWKTKKLAEQAIKNMIASGLLDSFRDWKPIPYETAICPTCGRVAEKEIIMGMGECLSCDKVRGDL
jgi:hypothetical protein